MCGLVGVINTTNTSRVDFDNFFKQALVADSVRGKHSTGSLIVDFSYKETTIKKLGNPFNLLDSPEFSTALQKQIRLMMGHNRWATKGGISVDTAHPFTHGDITLCHNGTLHAHRTLSSRMDFDVDSEAICHMLSESDDPIKSLEKIDGAFALTWYNSLTRTFHIARNKERELYLAKISDNSGKGAYLYASELGLLYWLAYRNSIKIDKPELVPVGKLLTFYLNGKSMEYSTELFTPKEFIKKEKGYGWYGNYYDYKNTHSSHANNEKQNKLAHLVNKIKEVYFWSFSPYKNGEYGECRGVWDAEDGTEVLLSAIHRNSYRKYLSEGPTRVRVTGVSKNGELFVIECPEVNEVKSNVIDYIPSKTNLSKDSIEDEGSNNQKKRGGVCRNCDCEVEEKNLFLSWNNTLFCNECRQLYPESIF